MDFSQLAERHFRVSLPAIAFPPCCALPLVSSLLARRYQGGLADLLARLFRRGDAARRCGPRPAVDSTRRNV